MLILKQEEFIFRLFIKNSKKQLNTKHFTLFFTLIIIFLYSVFIMGAANHLNKKNLDILNNGVEESTRNSMHAIAESVSFRLDSFITMLNIYSQETFFQNDNVLDIAKNVNELSNNFLETGFHGFFYVDKAGIAYFSQSSQIRVMDRDYYNAVFYDKQDTFVSSPIKSRRDGRPLIVLAKAIYDANFDINGILCFSLELKKFMTIFADLNKEIPGDISILDEYGRFIHSEDQNLLFREFIPEDEAYKKFSSSYIAQKKQGIIREVKIHNQKYYSIYFCPVPKTSWTFCLISPLENYKKIQRSLLADRVIIIAIGIVAMIFLLLINIMVLNYFQKNQMAIIDYDSVTKLWTREKFEREAEKQLKHHKNQKFMLVESDIKGFKFIVQNYGSAAADKLLFYYGTLLKSQTESHDGIIGRGYADHFYSLLKVDSIKSSQRVIKYKTDQIDKLCKNYEIPFFPKFGIAYLRPTEEKNFVTVQNLIGEASFAKESIKDNALKIFSIYDYHQLSKINAEREIEEQMEKALENKEFFVMYQPKIDLKTDEIVGAEALVRWNSRDGYRNPDEFIPVFEKNGFITKLDFYVYEKVFKFLQDQIMKGNTVVPISVNMSRNHTKPDQFLHDFLEIFNRYSIPANLVQIEILERSFMDNNTLKQITEDLHQAGFSVAMDDFGSGESSLNMLTKIPIDVLKFDKTFLTDNNSSSKGQIDEKNAKFIEILVELSKSLNKKTVFEGVETKAQRDFLRSINCDQVQGYFYSHPLMEMDFENFIKEHIYIAKI